MLRSRSGGPDGVGQEDKVSPTPDTHGHRVHVHGSLTKAKQLIVPP